MEGIQQRWSRKHPPKEQLAEGGDAAPSV